MEIIKTLLIILIFFLVSAILSETSFNLAKFSARFIYSFKQEFTKLKSNHIDKK